MEQNADELSNYILEGIHMRIVKPSLARIALALCLLPAVPFASALVSWAVGMSKSAGEQVAASFVIAATANPWTLIILAFPGIGFSVGLMLLLLKCEKKRAV